MEVGDLSMATYNGDPCTLEPTQVISNLRPTWATKLRPSLNKANQNKNTL